MQSEQQQFDQGIIIGADRTFGFVFATFFSILYIWQLWHGKSEHWLLGCAITFTLLGLIWPTLLHPLNVLWFKFGLLLHAITTPLILGVLFFVIVAPTGILIRMFGKHPLHLSMDSEASSYWIVRTPPGPAANSFRNQF